LTATPQNSVAQAPPEPLVWPIATKLQPGIRSFVGHTDTVLDVIGRIGTPPSLVIFTEGNHLMVLSSDDIVGAFPSWAKTQPRYADLDLTNIILVTLPQPILVQMIRTGGVALGNLTLDVSRRSTFYPDIFMGYPEPLRQLRQMGAIERQARFFSKNRGVALLVRKGNPRGIHGLADIVRTGTGWRSGTRRCSVPYACGCRQSARKPRRRPVRAEVPSFPGRLAIMHRDLPEMIARLSERLLTWFPGTDIPRPVWLWPFRVGNLSLQSP
jgi:hypothetical protein